MDDMIIPMLQANVDIALIQQVTGLDEVSIKKLA
jgi:hypothetical protein